MAYPSPARPERVNQIDGTYFAQQNCVCAVSADIIRRATLGRRNTTSAEVRRASGDRVGGLTYTTAAATIEAMTGLPMTVRFNVSRAVLRDGAAGGHPIGVSIWCKVTRYTFRRTNWFTGFHTVYVNDFEWTDRCRCEKHYRDDDFHGEYLIDDPGTTEGGYLWWSAALVYEAAEARTAAYGGSGIDILVGPDTEGVTLRATTPGAIRRAPSLDAAKVVALHDDQNYRVHRTVNGDRYTMANGRSNDIWAEVTVPGTSKTGYARGDKLRRAA